MQVINVPPLTKHAAGRANQRGVTHAAIGRLWLLADREVPVAASLSARSLSKSAIAEAIADGFSPSEVDRVRRLALVVSGDGAVVTVASIHGRKGRHYQRRMRRYWKG